MLHKVFRLFVDYEKEEKWLNEMAAKGYHFVHFSFPGRYLFEKGREGEYIYRLELLENMPGHLESKAYIEFMESTGVEYVAKYLRWVYFRKKAADGPFEVYTDHASVIKHYKRIIWLIGILGLVNLFCAFINLDLGLFNHGASTVAPFNTGVSILNLCVAFLCLTVVIKFWRRIIKRKKESQIQE